MKTTSGKAAFGRDLRREWKLDARCYFHIKGRGYNIPLSFPAALCDPKGYVFFKTEEDLKNCSAITLGARLSVKGGISRLPFYKRMR
jgi:hypothetical protein